MRQRFKSTVHFSPSPTAKEFILVVSFSSASFTLSEESVALALQSCIGGISSDFKVFKLSDRRFRFSLASIRVGHFIYGLKDRVWPDFVCQFHLYKGDHGFNKDYGWHADQELTDISARRGLAIQSNWLKSQASMPIDPSSSDVISKFGLFASPSVINSDAHLPADQIRFSSFSDPPFPVNHDKIRLGSFSLPIKEVTSSGILSFTGLSFRQNNWDSIHEDMLYHILDVWQAGFSDSEVLELFDIDTVPTYEYILMRLNSCKSCFCIGHSEVNCPGMICQVCSILVSQCSCNHKMHDHSCRGKTTHMQVGMC